jgi:RNA polymerase sigma factor (sigma-70 family)
VAYRMLGSLSEADDVLQDAWLRLSRADVSAVEDFRAWLTTVVARLCLDRLRTRRSRREDPLGVHVPDPLVHPDAGDPEEQAMLADSVGMAMLVVLETLTPAERLAFVLHDVFAFPFDVIGPIVERSPVATRQLASRARRKVRGSTIASDADLPRQREVVDAFQAASRAGDFEALLAVLDPDVVVRADYGRLIAGAATEVRGAQAVAEQALRFRRLAPTARPAIVNGAAGLVVFSGARPYAVMAFAVRRGRVARIDILADPERLPSLELARLLPAT